MNNLTFKFDEKAMNLLDELKHDLDLESNGGVIRRALTLLSVLNKANKDMSEFIVRDTFGSEQIVNIG